MSLSASMNRFSTQNPGEASSTFAFIPSEKFLSENFRDVHLDEEEPQPGDLFMFHLEISKQIGYHTGVYCGRGEIIHFMAVRETGKIAMIMVDCKGLVYKEGLRQMRSNRKLYRVLRKRGGIDIELLYHRVYEAMNNDPPRYNLQDNNCMHFALKLLDMDSMSMDVELTTMD